MSKKRKKFQKKVAGKQREKEISKKYIIQQSFNSQILAKNSNPVTRSNKKTIKIIKIFYIWFSMFSQKNMKG